MSIHPFVLRWKLYTVCAVLMAALPCHSAEKTTNNATHRISRGDLRPLKDGMPGEEGLQTELTLAYNVKMVAVISTTAKGNGLLRIGNLSLRIFDEHNDGVYYEGGMLNVDAVDIRGNATRDLVITGIVCFTDEKGDKVLRRLAVVFIYRLAGNNKFDLIYRNSEFRID